MHKVLLLPGDGIGPEIMAQAKKVLNQFSRWIEYEEGDIGGAAIDKFGVACPQETLDKAMQADAVILGAVGGHQWDHLPIAEKPEKGLLTIRKALNLYANYRPLDIFPDLINLSPLKAAIIQGVSFVVLRELTGDLYFGEPRKIEKTVAFNTMRYSVEEIRRIAHAAFKLARTRKKKVCSIDKANVLETMVLWRQTVSEIHKDYPDITLSHMYIDHAAMQIIKQPRSFDVILTPNMFGDILSDEAAVLSGSLGLLPSASLGDKHALYEPIHGSAPDIAGKNIANPIGLILSIAMMMQLSFGKSHFKDKMMHAVRRVIHSGARTADIDEANTTAVSTEEMGEQIVKYLSQTL